MKAEICRKLEGRGIYLGGHILEKPLGSRASGVERSIDPKRHGILPVLVIVVGGARAF